VPRLRLPSRWSNPSTWRTGLPSGLWTAVRSGIRASSADRPNSPQGQPAAGSAPRSVRLAPELTRRASRSGIPSRRGGDRKGREAHSGKWSAGSAKTRTNCQDFVRSLMELIPKLTDNDILDPHGRGEEVTLDLRSGRAMR